MVIRTEFVWTSNLCRIYLQGCLRRTIRFETNQKRARLEFFLRTSIHAQREKSNFHQFSLQTSATPQKKSPEGPPVTPHEHILRGTEEERGVDKNCSLSANGTSFIQTFLDSSSMSLVCQVEK